VSTCLRLFSTSLYRADAGQIAEFMFNYFARADVLEAVTLVETNDFATLRRLANDRHAVQSTGCSGSTTALATIGSSGVGS
jgi:hypothetical protein